MQALFLELNTPEATADLALIGLTEDYQQLLDSQAAFEAVFNERTESEAEKKENR